MAAAKKTKTFNVSTVIEPVTFNIDDDEFEALPANRLPAGVLVKYFQKINESQLFDANDEFFKSVLTEESAKLFIDRISSTEKPITIAVMGEVASWLIGEVYLQGEATEEPKA